MEGLDLVNRAAGRITDRMMRNFDSGDSYAQQILYAAARAITAEQYLIALRFNRFAKLGGEA